MSRWYASGVLIFGLAAQLACSNTAIVSPAAAAEPTRSSHGGRAVGACTAPSGANLVGNAGFDTGEVTWGPFKNGSPTVDAADCPASGSMNLALDGARASCIPVKAGTKYFFGFMAKGGPACCGIRWVDNCSDLGLADGETADIPHATAPASPTAWVHADMTVTAPTTGATGAEITCSATRSAAYVDRFYFSAVEAKF